MNLITFIFINGIFLYKQTSLEAGFYNAIVYILFFIADYLNKVRTKLKNIIQSFEITMNSKHRPEKLKTKNHRNRNMKNQNTQRRKLSFTKRIGRKCRLLISPY